VLDAQPVAVVMGARQTGKSTLVRHATRLARHVYLTLDALDMRAQAAADPEDLVARQELVIFDEIQRVPDLVIAIKRAIDEGGRRAGRFVITGSANLLGLRTVKETLAGRASYITLWPLTRREQLGLGSAGCWSELISTDVAGWPALLDAQTAPVAAWRDHVQRSAYPPVALEPMTAAQQTDWLQGYLETYIGRDVLDLAQLSRPLDLVRLMRASAAQIGQIEHQTTWIRVTGLPRTTVSRWADLMELSYQLVRLPAFSVNRTKRLARSPKIYWSDTAMALHLSPAVGPTGFHFENSVLTDLLAWQSGQSVPPGVFHWRTHDQIEVDFVVELPTGRLLPVEVEASPKPQWRDLTGLRVFLDEYADLAIGGLVLHGGEDTYRLSERIVATPWWRVM
jgi:predicted AAA+ superfamily ATPase